MKTLRAGPLTPETIGEVLDLLGGSPEPCSLTVKDGRAEKTFLFTPKCVRLRHTGGRTSDRLGEILVRHGKISPANRDELVSIARARGKPVGEQAIELGILTQQDIDSALRSQLVVHLSDLFFWPEAEFVLRTGTEAEETKAKAWEFAWFGEPAELIEDVRQRRQRWLSLRSFVPSDFEIFAQTGLAVEGSAGGTRDGATERVLALVDGERTVGEIVRESQLTAMEVYEVLQAAIIEGRIEKSRTGVVSLPTRREEILDEIRTLEAARRDDPSGEALLARLADSYLAIGEKDRAAKRWRELARLQVRRSAHEEALESLTSATRCAPHEFDTREQMLDIYAALGNDRQLLDEGCELGNIYFKRNLLDRARSLLGHLVYLLPREPRIRRLYALTLLGLGQRKLAVWQFTELANLLRAADAPDPERAEVYRQILALDRKHAEARRQFASLSNRGRGRWRLRAAIAACGAALVLFVGWILYRHAREARFAEEAAGVESLLAEGDFPSARALLAELEARHSGSAAREQLPALRNRIEYCEQEYLALGIEAELALARRLAKQGEVERALQTYARIGRVEPGLSGAVLTAREEAAALQAAEERARTMIHLAADLRARGESARAAELCREAVTLFPENPAVRALSLPVEIRTFPAGATVAVNGVPVPGVTPLQAEVALYPPSRVDVRMEGFDDGWFEAKAPLPAARTVSLPRALSFHLETGAPIEHPAAIVGDLLCVAGRDRLLRVLDGTDGAVLAQVPLGLYGDAETPPVPLGDMVVIGTAAGEIVAWDVTRRDFRWRASLGSVAPAAIAPDAEHGVVFVIDAAGSLRALRAETGEQLWLRQVDARPGPLLAVPASGVLVVLDRDRRRLIGVRAEDGARAWTHATSAPVGRLYDDGPDRICATLSDGTIETLGAADGSQIGVRVVKPLPAADPQIEGGRIWYEDVSGTLHAAPVAGGDAVWSGAPRGSGLVGVRTAGDEVYVATADGFLRRLEHGTGRLLWERPLGSAPSAAPLIFGNRVIVTTVGGEVIAVER